jgi:hypothetical protein
VGTGTEQTTYYLPPAALRAKSGFFRGCLSGSFKESQDKTIKLDDVDPQTFSFFVEWLFSEKVWDVTTVDAKDARQFELDVIAAWLLADRLVAEEFQNYCMDSIRHTHEKQAKIYGNANVLCGQDSTSGQLKAYYTQEMAGCMANARKLQAARQPHQFDSWLDGLDRICNNANGEAFKNLFLTYAEEREKIGTSGRFFEAAKLKGCHWHVHIDTPKEDCEAKFRG